MPPRLADVSMFAELRGHFKLSENVHRSGGLNQASTAASMATVLPSNRRAFVSAAACAPEPDAVKVGSFLCLEELLCNVPRTSFNLKTEGQGKARAFPVQRGLQD